MKKIFFFLLLCTHAILLSQTVPVTFHFRPPNTSFTALRLVGTMNGWNNADNALAMTDPDNDGEYTVTVSLTAGVDYAYKFCMNADWGLAYGDPDNPRINTADNDNSMLLVKDPMITYLLPRDKDSKNKVYVDTSKYGNPIRIIIASSAGKSINPDSLVISIDGVSLINPSQYYDSTKKQFLYLPDPPLPVGDHTISATIQSAAGTDSKSATYTRNPDQIVVKVPVDFYYDQNNKTVLFAQPLTDVAVVGSFNNWNHSYNPMTDLSGNGVWETTVKLEPDSIEYKIKLNKISWENDPDQPAVNPGSGNNTLIVVADSTASMKLLYPLENQTFKNDTTVDFKIALRPGAVSKGVDTATIALLYDGVSKPFAYNSDGTVTASILISGEGRHTVELSYKNKENNQADEIFSYGISPAAGGVYVVDGIGDDRYTYPAGSAEGSADILSVAIRETPQHDSLKFMIQMRAIDDRTRIGLLINNPAGALINDPRQLEIKLPDWNGQGVFASIGVPGNSYENSAVENRFMIADAPAAYDTSVIAVNGDAAATNRFEFTVSVAFLGRYMEGWTDTRDFCLFSYLANADKSGNGYEVGAAEGATSSVSDPDVYDAAFIRSTFWQRRIFANYRSNGSRLVSFDGTGRGLLPLTAAQISNSLASKQVYISFLTPPAEYWHPNVTIHGILSDSTLSTATLVFNGVETEHTVSNGTFDIPVTLQEGINTVALKVTDTSSVVTTSKQLVLMYTPDQKPAIQLTGNSTGHSIALTASASSPIGETLSYAWTGDAHNPASVSISSTTNSANFTLPQTDGEYIFTLTVTDAKSNSSFAKIAVKESCDSVRVISPGDNEHAAWIDSAVIYEIFPRSFSEQGGFQGITANINKIKSLGANTVWLMPVFNGPTVHGYEITDYYSLETDYGTNVDFVNMLAAMKQNGIRVILDMVINHTGIGHPFMQNAFKYKEYSPRADFYIWSGEPGASNFQYYFDWSSLPNLNYDNPDVSKYFIDVSKYWLQNYDIAGYRCDVAWGIQERNGTFWQEWRKGVRSVNPDAYLLAEASSADTTFYKKRFDSAYDWDLRNLMIGALNGSNTIGDLNRQVLRAYAPSARPFRFIENHDETRATSMFDANRSLLMHTIIFTLNGIPLIYSGGEVGETTQRDLINWSDPNGVEPYFARLVKIRKAYIHNPSINRIMNNDTADVYTYATISGDTSLVTAANFKNVSGSISVDLSTLPYDGSSIYYLTDLFTGEVIAVQPGSRSTVPVDLTNYQARVFYYGPTSISVSVPEKPEALVPKEMTLQQNYPNPFNPSTTISYGLTGTSSVKLEIYNVLGQKVKELVNSNQEAGWHSVTWNASAASGIYFYRIEAVSANNPNDRFVRVKKMMLLK